MTNPNQIKTVIEIILTKCFEFCSVRRTLVAHSVFFFFLLLLMNAFINILRNMSKLREKGMLIADYHFIWQMKKYIFIVNRSNQQMKLAQEKYSVLSHLFFSASASCEVYVHGYSDPGPMYIWIYIDMCVCVCGV